MKVGTDGVLIGAWADVSSATTALDIGSGCGLIALMLAQRNLNMQIDAVEIDTPSFVEMQYNFQQSPWPHRLHSISMSIQSFASETEKKYDAIVSNPPYFLSGTLASRENRKNARHALSLSQDDLIEVFLKLLSPEGTASLILPVDEAHSFINACKKKELHLSRKTTFRPVAHHSPERLLLSFKRLDTNTVEDTLVHYNEDRTWSEAYKNLTQDFHLNL